MSQKSKDIEEYKKNLDKIAAIMAQYLADQIDKDIMEEYLKANNGTLRQRL